MKKPEFVSFNNYAEYASDLEKYCDWLESRQETMEFRLKALEDWSSAMLSLAGKVEDGIRRISEEYRDV